MDFAGITFKEALQEDLRQTKTPTKIIAEEMDKSYSWLMNNANPECDQHHLRAAHLAPLLRRTGTFHALNWLEYQLGRVAFSLPEVPREQREMQQHLAVSVQAFGQVLEEIGKAVSPTGPGGRSILPSEAKRAELRITECVRDLMALLRGIQGEVKG